MTKEFFNELKHASKPKTHKKTMLIKTIEITNQSFQTIAKLKTKNELDNYMKKNPNTFADCISINNISMYGFDEIELFFSCKNINEFYKLIN